MKQEIQKILICTTKTKSNGVMGSGFSSFGKELIVVKELNSLTEAEDFKNIEDYIMIPIFRFKK